MLDLKNIFAALLIAAILLMVVIGVMMWRVVHTPVVPSDFPDGPPSAVVRQDLLDGIRRTTMPTARPGQPVPPGMTPEELKELGKAREEFMNKVAGYGMSAIPALREVIWGDYPTAQKEQSVQALRWVQQDEAMNILTEVLLKHPEGPLRALAAKVLGHRANGDVLHYLLAVKDPEQEKDEMVRSAATVAIANFRGQEGVDGLVGLLRGDPSPRVRRFAARSLGELGPEQGGGSDRVVSVLQNALRYDRSPEVKLQALDTLKRLRVSDLRVFLQEIEFEETDREVRQAIHEAIQER